VSHRIDNSSGQAYTEISLSSLLPIQSIKEIGDRFAGYTKSSYLGGGKDAINKLNRLYAATAHTDSITPEDYAMFDAGKAENKQALINTLTSRPGHRNICTLERLQNYLYGNKKTVRTWGDREDEQIASKVCPSRQWLTPEMHNNIMNILKYYKTRMMTNQGLPGYGLLALEDVSSEDAPVREPQDYDNVKG
jgi:hypothetical protein